VSSKQAWIWYTILRIVFFVVPFAIFLLLFPQSMRQSLTWAVVIAAVGAGIASFALSLIFLSPLRERAAMGIVQWRAKKHVAKDDEAEDEVLDEAGATDHVDLRVSDNSSESHTPPGGDSASNSSVADSDFHNG
jgi:hypothetical protein